MGTIMPYMSSGFLRYHPPYKVIVEADQELSRYYRSLIPKSVDIKVPMYAPHITVVRKEVPPKMEVFGKHEGELVFFEYDTEIHHDETYYWLNAYSKRLEEIREELGLPVMSAYTRPPDGRRCFHITIGNLKS